MRGSVSLAGLLGDLRAWARENQNLPGFVVLLSGGERTGRRQAAVGLGLPAERVSGRAVPLAGRAGAVSSTIPPGVSRALRRACSTRIDDINRQTYAAVRRSGDADAHRAVRDGVPHAARATDAMDIQSGARSSAGALRRRAGRRRASPTTACWRGGWPSAACGSFSSITGAGTRTAAARGGR